GHRMSGMPLIQISDDNPPGTAESHFRNVKVEDRRDNNRRALVNLGGGPRPTPKTPKGVPIYLHDYFGPNRHAKVVSTRAKDLMTDGSSYREEPSLTGDEPRVAEVHDIPFPTLLNPVDDRPPTTVITHVGKSADGKVTVRGTTADNGTVKKVVVNGRDARPLGPNFAEWEVVLEEASKLEARAEDTAGNVETQPHVVTGRAPKCCRFKAGGNSCPPTPTPLSAPPPAVRSSSALAYQDWRPVWGRDRHGQKTSTFPKASPRSSLSPV